MEQDTDRDADLLMRLEEQLTEPAFMSETEAYLNQHLESFREGEQSLECYRVFQHFSALVAAKLDAFVAAEGTTEDQVFATVQQAYATDSNCLTCFEYIFAACEYTEFLSLMLERKQLLEWELDTS